MASSFPASPLPKKAVDAFDEGYASFFDSIFNADLFWKPDTTEQVLPASVIHVDKPLEQQPAFEETSPLEKCPYNSPSPSPQIPTLPSSPHLSFLSPSYPLHEKNLTPPSPPFSSTLMVSPSRSMFSASPSPSFSPSTSSSSASSSSSSSLPPPPPLSLLMPPLSNDVDSTNMMLTTPVDHTLLSLPHTATTSPHHPVSPFDSTLALPLEFSFGSAPPSSFFNTPAPSPLQIPLPQQPLVSATLLPPDLQQDSLSPMTESDLSSLSTPSTPHWSKEKELEWILKHEMNLDLPADTPKGKWPSDVKKKIRMVKNRIAASESRRRAKIQMLQMQRYTELLMEENQRIQRELVKAQHENAELKQALQTFASSLELLHAAHVTPSLGPRTTLRSFGALVLLFTLLLLFLPAAWVKTSFPILSPGVYSTEISPVVSNELALVVTRHLEKLSLGAALDDDKYFDVDNDSEHEEGTGDEGAPLTLPGPAAAAAAARLEGKRIRLALEQSHALLPEDGA